MMEWTESLPQRCPPQDATEPCGSFYRAASSKFSENDFIPYKRLFPNKTYNDGCIALAISIFSNVNDCRDSLKLPAFKKKGLTTIVEVPLTKNDGLILKTGNRSHYSWWRSKNFNFESIKQVEDE